MGPNSTRTYELLRKVFEILVQFPDGLQARDVIRRVAEACPPTEFENSNVASGTKRFDKNVRFATIPAVKAGWLIKEKGRWIVTDLGRTAFDRFKEPEPFGREAKRLFTDWMAQRVEVSPDEADETSENAETIDEIEEQAFDGVRAYLETMEPYRFQQLVAALLKAMGYEIASVARPGPDRGIDIVAFKDPFGGGGPRVKVQVRRRADKADADDLRSFVGLLTDNSDIGVFVCTGGFTSSAESEARAQHAKRVTLIELGRLVELWIEYYSRLDNEDKKLLPLRPVYYLDRV